MLPECGYHAELPLAATLRCDWMLQLHLVALLLLQPLPGITSSSGALRPERKGAKPPVATKLIRLILQLGAHPRLAFTLLAMMS